MQFVLLPTHLLHITLQNTPLVASFSNQPDHHIVYNPLNESQREFLLFQALQCRLENNFVRYHLNLVTVHLTHPAPSNRFSTRGFDSTTELHPFPFFFLYPASIISRGHHLSWSDSTAAKLRSSNIIKIPPRSGPTRTSPDRNHTSPTEPPVSQRLYLQLRE